MTLSLLRLIGGLSGLACSLAAAAVTIVGASPQGEVAQVNQVVLKFSEAAVSVGDPRQADPAGLSCNGATPQGSGHWNSEREWVYALKDSLPPGTRCTIKVLPGWKPLTGVLTGPTEFRFNTGGPAVRRTHPWSGGAVDEDQLFILELTGPVAEA